MSRRQQAALGLLVALLIGAAPAAASAPTRTELNSAQLTGKFRLTGVITAASGVPGERRGQHVTRAWAFVGSCPKQPCAAVGVLRARANGIDGTLLKRRSTSLFSGSGSFALAVSCGGRRYPTGLVVPYSITVRLTAVEATAQGIFVRAIRATYVSRSRANRTPCVVPPAHDSARYTGQLS